MANEAKNLVAQIKVHVGAIAGIRGTSHGQPLSIPNTPWAGVWLSDGGTMPYTFGTSEDTHHVTVRFYWNLTSPEDTENDLEDMLELAMDKLWGDVGMTDKATYCVPTGYRTGYQDVAGNTYRTLDITVEAEISGTSITV